MNSITNVTSLNQASLSASPVKASLNEAAMAGQEAIAKADDAKLRETFGQFVGQTFFGQMMKAMRTSVGKPVYFHGGRGEEVFQSQLDQVMVEKMSEAAHEDFAEPMYELFQMNRR